MVQARFLIIALLLIQTSVFAQDAVLERVRIEVVSTQRQYDNETHVSAFQGEKLPIVEFEAEFQDGGEVTGIELQFPNSSIRLTDSERDGDIFRLSDIVQSSNISLFRGTYRLNVEPNQGDNLEYEFHVDFDLNEDFPEVRYPIDGIDRIDYQLFDAEWDAFADSYRIDLFDFPLGGFHQTIRTFSEIIDLGGEVDRNEAYELWIGSTEEEFGDTDGNFEVEAWFTSSAVLFFCTGPRSRNQLSEYNSSEIIESASVINRVKRVGQFSDNPSQSFVARVVGNRLFDVETARIKGEMDGRLDNIFVRLDSVVPQQVFEKEISAQPGDSYLFLVEFLEFFGSQTCKVAQTLSTFPEIVTPSSNASGLSGDLMVEWNWSGPQIVRFEVALQEIGSPTETDRIVVQAGEPMEAEFTGLLDNSDYQLQVSAHTADGAEAVTCIWVSTGLQGDANNDGIISGLDLFGETLVWHSSLPNNQSFPATSSLGRIDMNGDEVVD
ncbi:MAG: fibronectin type III domain-containing protein, partial [Candidatus Omnitrophica bacterium]|nr:fibronectin type III domain-containing protein [Candidatus Omnitrophota bacterium]